MSLSFLNITSKFYYKGWKYFLWLQDTDVLGKYYDRSESLILFPYGLPDF